MYTFKEIKEDSIPKIKEQQERFTELSNDYTTAADDFRIREAQKHRVDLEFNAHKLKK